MVARLVRVRDRDLANVFPRWADDRRSLAGRHEVEGAHRMSRWEDRSLREDVLANGVDDWVDAGWLRQIAQRSAVEDGSQLRQLSIGLIAELLVEELVVAGSIEGGKHVVWDGTPGEALVRIVGGWKEWGDEPPMPGAIVWLDLTEAGRAIGEAVLRREA